jgi:hypothetical protein
MDQWISRRNLATIVDAFGTWALLIYTPSVTTLGAIYLTALAVSLLGGVRGVAIVACVGVGFPDSAVFASASLPFPPFYIGIGFLLVVVALARLSGRITVLSGPPTWGVKAFFAYGALLALVAPTIFSDIGVITTNTIDMVTPQPLAYTVSTASQVVRLGVALAVVVVAARSRALSPWALTVGLAFGVIIAATALVSRYIHIAWPYELFDNAVRGKYSIEVSRERAQFSEPSHLGAFSLLTLAYFGTTVVISRNLKRRLFALFLAVLSGFLLVASASGTGTMGALVFLLAAGSIVVSRAIRFKKIKIPVGAALALIVLASVGVILVPRALDGINEVVSAKVGSVSQSIRLIQDRNGLAVFGSSDYFGVGFGGNRTSSLATLLLSQVGILGSILFFVACWVAIRNGFRNQVTLPAAVALIAFLSAAIVSFADIASPFLWSLFATCMIPYSEGYGPRKKKIEASLTKSAGAELARLKGI